jgi:hypothetical protein
MPGHPDPPSFAPGHPDPPSWSSQSMDPPSWTKRTGIPAQSSFSTETPDWLIPDRTESTVRANRPSQQRAGTLPGSITTASSLTPTNYSSPLPLSIIHSNKLPNLNIILDDALAEFETNISPWKTPSEYIDAEANRVNTVVQEIRLLTRRDEMEHASFIGQPMVYSVS